MNWGIEEYGYQPITTFWQDFSIADHFGIEAIKDTYHRAFQEWKTDYKYLTELVMVLNHKGWQHQDNYELCRVYTELWEQTDDYACKRLKGEKLNYFLKTVD